MSYSLTSLRVIGIVSDEGYDTSTLHIYREQMILYLIFLAMERTSYNKESSFLSSDSVSLFNLITDCGTLEGSRLQSY